MNDCAICGGPEADHGVLNGYHDKHAFEPRVEDEGVEPDGYVILHIPPDNNDAHLYGVGPFPPNDELAESLIKGAKCDCRLEVLPIAFPAGIKMLVGVDLDQVMDIVKNISEGKDPFDEPRLN